MMGSLRRPRPRFMSSPVLSDLSRFHSSSTALQLSNTRVWNSVQSAVMKVFQGEDLQPNELYSLNESIRWLLRTEMGSFIPDFFQNQLLPQGLADVLHLLLTSGDEEVLMALSVAWERFFTETLPTLQAIFYPVQGQELSVRQMALLSFRDLVLLKLPLEDTLGTAACVPPAITQMLLVLQGVHDSSASSQEYVQLERLVEVVVSPYLSNITEDAQHLLLESLLLHTPHSEVTGPQTSALVSFPAPVSASVSLPLGPLLEQEGEAYLEKSTRRHTVASVLTAAFRTEQNRTSINRGGLGNLLLRGRSLCGGGGAYAAGAESLLRGSSLC
ncbi:unnamed protein product [Knipowitschia caucasica]